ncbi:hypothetical protein MUB24_18745 [Lederbergia sp. NSJ-179]|uniref:hypothetical protein n=1 Tax=Lederbergia sp. NSJ-179 TaxID=2931402 RepID=UPI001FD35B9C|nr:hypothetical protein [Lederbergia sp. NSJ-179]MCJ7842879.1 hypothetical protein [Lederbergia sp. NSJ-179]
MSERYIKEENIPKYYEKLRPTGDQYKFHLEKITYDVKNLFTLEKSVYDPNFVEHVEEKLNITKAAIV